MATNWGANAAWGNAGTQQPAPPQAQDNGEDQAFDWGDTQICEEGGNILLAPGEYEFRVKFFERDYYNGNESGSKPCPMAKLSLEIQTQDGPAIVRDRLYLKRSAKWRMDDFFRSIGVARLGQPYTPDWTAIAGMAGRARIKTRTYNDRKYNEVERYIYPKG